MEPMPVGEPLHPVIEKDAFPNSAGLLGVTGNRRGVEVAPFAETCITVDVCVPTPNGTATLICDADTYSNCAGLPSNVTDTPASDSAPPSGATTPTSGPRLVPNRLSKWLGATSPTCALSAASST